MKRRAPGLLGCDGNGMIMNRLRNTDTLGITAAAAGTLFMAVRVWDAIFDPIMGIIADRRAPPGRRAAASDVCGARSRKTPLLTES